MLKIKQHRKLLALYVTNTIQSLLTAVARPVPLSVTVNRTMRSQAISQATLIRAVLEKVREVKQQPEDPSPSASPA